MGERVACLMADKVIVISPSLAEYARAKYKIDAAYIPNGVGLPKIVKADKIKKWGLKKDNYILTVTRLVGHKGVQYLIGAYKNLKTNKKLVIVGDGAYTDNYVNELKAMAADNKKIIFTGNQTDQALAELYSNAYLFVQPSESEGLSIALLEAMSYKRCVLVSDIRENTDVTINCGFSFKNKSIKSLQAKLNYLLEQPQLVKKLGQSVRARVSQNYNWSKIISSTLKLYDGVASEKEVGDYKKVRLIKRMVNFLF